MQTAVPDPIEQQEVERALENTHGPPLHQDTAEETHEAPIGQMDTTRRYPKSVKRARPSSRFMCTNELSMTMRRQQSRIKGDNTGKCGDVIHEKIPVLENMKCCAVIQSQEDEHILDAKLVLKRKCDGNRISTR